MFVGRHRRGVLRRILPAVFAATAALPASAAAAPDCADVPRPVTVASGFGRLESVIADRQGRLYFVETGNTGRLLRLSAPGEAPEVLVSGIANPRGLAFDSDGSLLLGFGGDGVLSQLAPNAGLLRVDPRTGAHSVYVTGLEMANGVAVGPDGEIYASNNFGTHVQRVIDGQVELDWAAVTSANGLVVDRAGSFLYAAQTFQPAAIKRVEIANPENVETYVTAGPEDIAAGPDGMTRDERDRLYVAANGAGQVWRGTSSAGSARCGAACRSVRAPSPSGPEPVASPRPASTS